MSAECVHSIRLVYLYNFADRVPHSNQISSTSLNHMPYFVREENHKNLMIK
ncbi:MAG: hypothetical protein ACW98D_14450 [Promethearchaeota archaeon]